MWPPPWIGGEEVGNLGGGVAPVRGKGWAEFDCLTSDADVSCKILSQMCGSWNFPKFLLSNGSFTCMNMVSFMFLEDPCVFWCIILKHCGLRGCPIELL